MEESLDPPGNDHISNLGKAGNSSTQKCRLAGGYVSSLEGMDTAFFSRFWTGWFLNIWIYPNLVVVSQHPARGSCWWFRNPEITTCDVSKTLLKWWDIHYQAQLVLVWFSQSSTVSGKYQRIFFFISWQFWPSTSSRALAPDLQSTAIYIFHCFESAGIEMAAKSTVCRSIKKHGNSICEQENGQRGLAAVWKPE